MDQLDVSHMRRYARQLKQQVDAGELAGSTAITYWNYIAAFLGWCVYEELVAESPSVERLVTHAERPLGFELFFRVIPV